MSLEDMKEVTRIPGYGMKRKLDHKYPETWSQDKKPTIRQILKILPLIFRYLLYYVKMWWKGRKIIMDFIRPLKGKQIYGVPLGGLGCGSIGRGYKGEFCRYQLTPGIYEYNTIDANQFIITIKDTRQVTLFQSLLSTYKRDGKHLSSWQSSIDGYKCNYTGLYPRSWTEYDLTEYGVKLVCRQISPVIPNNYKDSSLPTSMFVWDVENTSQQDLLVTISFTLKNGTGNEKSDSKAICTSKSFNYLQQYEGVVLYNTIDLITCAYSISTRSRDDANVTKCLYIDPLSDGKKVWDQLYTNGRFDKIVEKHVFGEMACGVSSQILIKSHTIETYEFNLVWDAPNVTFPDKKRKYTKYYTKYFGTDNAPLKIVDYSFKNYKNWEIDIYNWQKDVLDDPTLPDWYKGALFNETYYVSDGGSLWFLPDDEDVMTYKENDDPRLTYGRFAYLEGHEYRMYNTYDVHFYASFALAINWPILQMCLQYDLRDSIFVEIPDTMTALYNGVKAERKVKYTVPHDLGDPSEEPFTLINAYPIHDVSEWRDLNTKFVLQVFRDYNLFRNVDGIDSERYLKDMYKACDVVMEKTKLFDVDGDGLIENTGTPDQTYDIWVMTGSSSYCGSLWLAALYAMTIIAEKLSKRNECDSYKKLLDRGKKAFDDKLWNGKFYKFDTTKPDTIMTDQLCGHWYLRTSNVIAYDVFEKDRVKSSLKTIYENNVMKFKDGNLGSVNGYLLDGNRVDTTALQSEEVWIGVNYGLASMMIYEGMVEEGLQTIEGLYNFLTDVIGMAFETPEAICEKDYYRAVGYMRPLAIWSMHLALKNRSIS